MNAPMRHSIALTLDQNIAARVLLMTIMSVTIAKNISKERVFISCKKCHRIGYANHALNPAFILVRDAIKASVLPALEVTGRKSGWRDIVQPVRVIC
jgi:hypothetical protein